MEEKKKINRKQFLRMGGSILAGGAIAGVSGKLLRDMFRNPEVVFFDADGEGYAIEDPDTGVSPYRRLLSVRAPGEVEAFDVQDGRMVVAGEGMLSVFDAAGRVTDSFAVGPDVRDLCVRDGEIHVLYPARIEVFAPSGETLRAWDACSDNADYCALAVTEDSVFATDVFAKNICQYRRDGTLVRFIDSPDGFVIPSYTFAVAAAEDGGIFCSNPGRHRIEHYSSDGKFLGAFGQAGTQPGSFSGCCNPVHLTLSPAGEIITSEKGIPRICCYSPRGEFRSTLLNRKALGGGYDAYEARIAADGRILVAGKAGLAVYQYDSALAQAGTSSACALCAVAGCPVRRGVTV